MKLTSSSSKPITSPGRAATAAAKFPPPLMRFLRTNVGSRSTRPRSRARGPLFLRKRRPSSSAATETQEPSSPKVTCIGQVRVRRKKNRGHSKGGTKNKKKKNRFRWRFCHKPSFRQCGSIRVKVFGPVWRMWAKFFYCGSSKVETDSSRNESNRVKDDDAEEDEDDDDDEEEEVVQREIEERENETLASAALISTPPKNALMLTRCRSAPYRSSSLAGRFWGSPLRTGEEAQKTEEEEESRATPASENEHGGRDSASQTRGDREGETGEGGIGTCAAAAAEVEVEMEVQSRQGGKIENDVINGVGHGGSSSPARRPLMLLRCRSEPARRTARGEKLLDPLTSQFWRERRLGNTESCTPQSHALD